jgi:hypothetical protein
MKRVDPLEGIKKKNRKRTAIAIAAFLLLIIILNIISAGLGKYSFVAFLIGIGLAYLIMVKIYKASDDMVCPSCGKPILMESRYPVMGSLQYPKECYFCHVSFASKELEDGKK